MTPEKARKLREKATPGPWERHPDKPWALCNLERKLAVHMELVKDRGLDPHPEDVANTELIAAAPELAELVAGLRYEYAVEARLVPGGAWHQVTKWTPDPSPVLPDGRELERDERIVRRLVGDPEVVPE